jgi:hypothetical protein
MKKIGLPIVLSIVMLIALPLTAYADTQNSTSTSITTYSDGSYLVTKITRAISIAQTTTQTTGTKTTSCYTSDNKLAWDFSVTGTFRYNGTSATAISSSASDHIYNSDWSCASKSTSYSGASATASGVFKSVSALTKNVTATLTCSPSGALS